MRYRARVVSGRLVCALAAAVAASQLADLTAPSKYSKRMSSLVTGFNALRADLSTISTAATKHNAQSAETRALLTDAAKVRTADTSLSRDLGLLQAQKKSQS